MARESASTRYIHELQGRGYNYAQIGRATGVNRSLIRQIGQGTKPGRNLTPALRALAKSDAPPPKRGQSIEGVKVPEPTHKTTKSGERAAVRQKEQQVGAPGQKGAGTTVERRTAKAGLNAIKRAAARGQNVKVTITFDVIEEYQGRERVTDARVELFSKGGEDAQSVLERFAQTEGSAERGFAEMAKDVLGARIEKAKGFQSIEVYAFNVDRPK